MNHQSRYSLFKRLSRASFGVVQVVVLVLATTACTMQRNPTEAPTPSLTLYLPTVTPIPATPPPTVTPVVSPTPTAIADSRLWTLSRTLDLKQYGATFQVWTSPCVAIPWPDGGSATQQVMYQQEIRLSLAAAPTAEVIARRINGCGPGLGAYGLDIVRTSADGRYMFYTDAAIGGPDGGGPIPWARPAYRYDLETRTQVALKLDVTSPDDRYVAYEEDDSFALVNWSSGIISHTARMWRSGGLMATAWSADSSGVAFLESPKRNGDMHMTFALTVWDIASNRALTMETPSAADGTAPVKLSWARPNALTLTYRDTTTRTMPVTADVRSPP